jgi:hypothetical protein
LSLFQTQTRLTHPHSNCFNFTRITMIHATTPHECAPEHHPLFGSIQNTEGFNQLFDAHTKSAEPSEHDQFSIDNLDAILDGTVEMPLRGIPTYRAPITRAEPDSAESFQTSVRADFAGTWDAHPPNTPPQSGDEIDDSGIVWRLRPLSGPESQRPDHLYDHAVSTATKVEALLERLQAELGSNHPQTVAAEEALQTAYAQRLQARKAAEAWQETGEGREWDLVSHDGRAEAWAKINDYRKGEGREARNDSRRKVRENPNARLDNLTPEERVAYRNEQKRLQKQRARALEKATKAAQSGDLSAAIS